MKKAYACKKKSLIEFRLKNKGFSLIEVIIGIGLISGTFLILSSQTGASKNAEVKVMNKLSRSVLNQLIISRLAYEDVCKMALNIPATNLSSLITSSGGELVLTLKDGTTVKSGAQLDKFNILVNTLTIADIKKIRSAYGFTFYSGEIFISNTLTKSLIKGSATAPTESLGPLQFLVNSSGAVVSCASVDNLQDSAIYLAAKNNP